MTESPSYLKIHELIKEGKLRLIGITAPARTASTAFEIAVASNAAVDSFVNQPFGLSYKLANGHEPDDQHPYIPPKDREEEAYKRILERYQEVRQEKHEGEIVLVVKEMTRNLGFKDTMDRYQALLDKEIVLIRNPLLSAASAIKNLIMKLSPRREELHGMKLSEESLKELQALADNNQFRELGEKLEKLGIAYDLNALIPTRLHKYLDRLTDETAWALRVNPEDPYTRYENLDDYARKKGWADWKTLKETKQRDDNLSLKDEDVGELLGHIIQFSATGRFAMAEEFKEVVNGERLKDNQIVVDATLLRLNPKEVLGKLFEKCGLDGVGDPIFDSKVLEKLNIEVDGDEDEKAMFERVLKSKTIEPPNEKCPDFACFPPVWQNHIVRTAMPTYMALLQHSLALPRTEEEVSEVKKRLRYIDPIFGKAAAFASLGHDRNRFVNTDRKYLADVIGLMFKQNKFLQDNNLRGEATCPNKDVSLIW